MLISKALKQTIKLSLLTTIGFQFSVHADIFDFSTSSKEFKSLEEESHTIPVNESLKKISLEGVAGLELSECEISFKNHPSEFIQFQGEGIATSKVIKFESDRYVKDINCSGSSLAGSSLNIRGKKSYGVKVNVPAMKKLAKLKKFARNRNVNLGARSINVCVEKSRTMIKLNTQARYWQINGRRSNKSTWYYRGSHARLKADYATADIVARCNSRGSETFGIQWMLNFNDPNRYNMMVTVNCVPCGDKRAVKEVRQLMEKAKELKKAGKLKRAHRVLEKAKKKFDKLIEREVLPPKQERKLKRELAKTTKYIFTVDIVFGESLEEPIEFEYSEEF